MYFKTIIRVFFLLLITSLHAQKQTFTHQDTLRGSLTNERIWWDLSHYDLSMKVDISNKSLKGINTITYKVLKENQLMQIDLQPPMKITAIKQDDNSLTFRRDGNVYYIKLSKKQQTDSINKITINYEGIPKESENPPWDDGITWSKDKNGNDFIATSCQGGGASIWWPCKDHMYDEPENGIKLSITTPEHLIGVANGRLKDIIKNQNKSKTYVWEVKNPINNYGVNINIGDFVHFNEKYLGEQGELDCNYYVLSYNLEKAKKQFKQAQKMLKAFEYWFGPYPFYEDSFKLVEVPYLGMEHQSSVTYGNQFQNGYNGSDLSGSGWGLKFDFIIIHESGHEWFANSITYKDIADMWIHESFTAYAENLYLDYYFGTQASNEYVVGTRRLIRNDRPIIGIYDVNYAGSGDMYYKGANMLHTLRQVVDNDKKWRSILRGLNSKFYHQTVTTKQIEAYLSSSIGLNLTPFFNQYLRSTKIPVLEYLISKNQLLYRWANIVDDFDIPMKILVNEEVDWIRPTNTWKVLPIDSKEINIKVDNNFYITTKNLTIN
mgnify:CR=1 FL=1